MPLMKMMNICPVIPIEDTGRYLFEKVIDLRFAVEPKEMGTICKGDWNQYTTEDRSDVFDRLLGIYPAIKEFSIPVRTVEDGFILINASMVSAARNIVPKYIEPLCGKLLKTFTDQVVLVGQSQPWNQELKEIKMTGVDNWIDRTTLPQVIEMCAQADMIITPDTGTLHIAAALGKKTLALFGNINPRTRISYYPTVRALYAQGHLPCIPCWDVHTCMGKPEHGSKCMQLFTPARIVEAVKQLGGA
jgi:ADP-heptose:LPS heptosyltransferase